MGMARAYPTPDESFRRLHAAGWSVGETGTATCWIVSGTNGENQLAARGSTQAEAWHRAVEQAEALGMLGRSERGGCGLTTWAVPVPPRIPPVALPPPVSAPSPSASPAHRQNRGLRLSLPLVGIALGAAILADPAAAWVQPAFILLAALQGRGDFHFSGLFGSNGSIQ
jgi:hypothetical protein